MFRADAQHSGSLRGSRGAAAAWHQMAVPRRRADHFHPGGGRRHGVLRQRDHNVYAVDEHTGLLRWKFATHGRVSSSPAVVDGRVYLGSYDGNLYALDAASGKLRVEVRDRGRAPLQRPPSSRRGAGRRGDARSVRRVPVLARGRCGHVYFGSGDGNVYALAADNGALRWRFKTGNVVHASPALADGILYVGSWDSYFYALDAKSGVQRWRFKTGEDPAIGNQVGIQSSAAIANGIVYFGCRDSHLYALDAASGARALGVLDGDLLGRQLPAVRDGIVYFATSDTAAVHAVDAASGAPLYSLSFNHWPFFSSPTLAGDYLYIGSHSGKLIADQPQGTQGGVDAGH